MTIDDVIAFARSLDGMTADPSTPFRAEYLDLIAPGETPQRAAEMATMSGCALTMRGVLRRFIVHPVLEAPYRTGNAMSDLLRISGGSCLRATGEPPQPGDIVIVEGPEHTWIATDVDCSHVCAIDGGQVVDRYQCVSRREHTVSDGWDVTATYRRRVRAVIDVGAVVAKFGR